MFKCVLNRGKNEKCTKKVFFLYKKYFNMPQSLNHTVIKESCFTHFEAIFVHLAIIEFDDGAGKISLLIITWQSQRVTDPALKKLGSGSGDSEGIHKV